MTPEQLNEWFPIILAITIGVIILLIVYINHMLNKKRSEAFQKKANELGYKFSKKMKKPEYDFEIFSFGIFNKSSNLITFNKNGREWNVFDYYYKKGGKNGEAATQTILLTDLDVPDFFMKPETMIDRIGDKFTKKDVDFKEYPIFSKEYVLQGNNLELKKLFKPKIIQYFENKQSRYHIQVKNKKILIYYKKIKINPEEIQQYIDEMSEILKLFNDENQNEYSD